jgi:hypothetical protein
MRPKRSAKPKLGRLKKIHPADYWQNAADFRQWLAEADNLELLSEALGFDLAIQVAQDEDVEVDDACLLGCDLATAEAVLICTQLEASDAMALGQLITQAAATEPPIVVWVTPNFTDDHATALDWLNQLGDPDTVFFGVETELWSIGKDAMAVNFKCVVEPGAGQGEPEVEGEEVEADPEPDPEPEPLSDMQLENLDFWAMLSGYMEQQGTLVKPGTPSPDATMGFAIARAGFRLYAIIDRDTTSLHTQLLLAGVDAHPHFYLLAHEQDLIADEIGIPLQWDDSTPETCSITSTLRDADIAIRDHWPDYVAWFSDCLERFYETFFERIKQLDATLYEPLPHYATESVEESLFLPASHQH